MGIRQPGEDNSPLPSVRVEVGDAPLNAPIPEMVGPAHPRPTGVITALVLGVLVVLGGTLYFLAPESGQAADGTDISPTTSEESPDAEVTTTLAESTTTRIQEPNPLLGPEVAADRSELGEGVFPLEVFDSAEPPGFLIDATLFGDTWVGVAFGDDFGNTDFVISANGLDWEVANSFSTPGQPMGLSQVDDLLVVAVNISDITGRSFEFDGTYDVRFFETVDLVNWQPSSAYAPMSGIGAAFFATIGNEAVAIPTRRIVDDPEFDELVEFFDGVLRPERARQICVVEYRMVGGSRLADLFDCDRNFLGELQEDDAPALFADQSLLARCVTELREGAKFREALLLQGRRETSASAEAEIIEVDQLLVGLGRMFGETYLSGGYGPGFFSDCAPAANEESRGWNLYRTTADEGSVTVASFDGFSTDNSRPAQAANGDAYIVGNSVNGVTFAQARPPYTDWERVPLTEDPNLRTATWTIALDGSIMLGTTRERWSFVTPDGEVVRELAVVGGQDAQLLLATEEYAIVSLQFERQRLIRVPLVDE